eukprot:CAMPEP_0203758502 /NCGR_PEP_ID=MMETSP0098-20131031/11351_1 /ASSEMBLY_ACC=CAM_ASM_000208 /TAXON_ID=96639 /ORGANISM=" , Strain NY0313808BC1" /LENGTH=314 /DNA_ID=CAMNT_0050650977 /DNA_START=155 /DNA_END=1099 /DNA_ORIENTATION=-
MSVDKLEKYIDDFERDVHARRMVGNYVSEEDNVLDFGVGSDSDSLSEYLEAERSAGMMFETRSESGNDENAGFNTAGQPDSVQDYQVNGTDKIGSSMRELLNEFKKGLALDGVKRNDPVVLAKEPPLGTVDQELCTTSALNTPENTLLPDGVERSDPLILVKAPSVEQQLSPKSALVDRGTDEKAHQEKVARVSKWMVCYDQVTRKVYFYDPAQGDLVDSIPNDLTELEMVACGGIVEHLECLHGKKVQSTRTSDSVHDSVLRCVEHLKKLDQISLVVPPSPSVESIDGVNSPLQESLSPSVLHAGLPDSLWSL